MSRGAQDACKTCRRPGCNPASTLAPVPCERSLSSELTARARRATIAGVVIRAAQRVDTPEARLSQRAAQREIRRLTAEADAAERLPLTDDVLALHEAGYKQAEIAHRLHISVATVSLRLRAAGITGGAGQYMRKAGYKRGEPAKAVTA